MAVKITSFLFNNVTINQDPNESVAIKWLCFITKQAAIDMYYVNFPHSSLNYISPFSNIACKKMRFSILFFTNFNRTTYLIFNYSRDLKA